MQHTIKRPCKPLATALAALLAIPILAAPRPLTWRADFPSAQVATFPVRHGTDVEFRPSWHINGVPANTNGEWTLSLSVQTNGAPAGEWAIIPGAVFSHTNDCGADAYNVLVRAVDRDGTVDYSAAARLRMLPSPGFSPGALPPAATFQESDPVFSAWRSTFQETDPVFSTWLSTFTIPETSLEPSTNYTDRSLSDFAATGIVARARSYGTPTRWTDSTGCVWKTGLAFTDWTFSDGLDRAVIWGEYYDELGWPVYGEDVRGTDSSDYEWFITLAEATNATRFVYVKEDGTEVTATRTTYESTNLVGRIALTNDIPAAPDLSPIQQDIADLRTENAIVYRLYSGSNIVAEVTNFSSQVHAPELRLMQLNESNEYVTVWAEANGLTRTLKRANEYTDNATGAVARASAPRAWGRTTSGLGADAPSNTTWISTEKLVIASGLEYVHIDSAGVWILCANGQVDFSTPTNSFFSISTDSGENVFSVERTDSRPIPVYCDGIKVASSGDNTIVTVPVPVVDATENANEPPFLNVALDLNGPWYSETNGIPSKVVSSCSWDGQNGAWTNTVVLSASHPRAFFNYSKWQAGGTVIRNKAAIEASGGILCTDGIHKGRPVYNNGTIIWEVVP